MTDQDLIVCPNALSLGDDSQKSYEIAFSDNNPQITFKDRTSSSSDLKEVFSKFDLNCPHFSAEILSRARFLCAKYLGGAWTRTPANQFKIKAITGGMSNLLFLVELSPDIQLMGPEPRIALLRIYCQGDLDQLLSESVVFTLLSERSLGPKLLGVFPGGRFEQFVPSRSLQCVEIIEPKFAKIIAPMLARVHTLDVPITKDPEIMNTACNWLQKLRKMSFGSKVIDMRLTRAEVDISKFPITLSYDDLAAELDFVSLFLENSGSPIVFSHNDMQEGNILLFDGYTIEDDGRVSHEGQPCDVTEPLVLIDFEYCSYNYRGFDLGNHMCEYAFDYAEKEHPYYKIYNNNFHASVPRRTFCESYLEEVYKMRESGDNPHFPSDLVTGDKEKDLLQLEEEAELFMGVSHIFWVTWALWNAENALVSFDYASYARDRLALYYDGKQKMVDFLKSKGVDL